MQEANTSYRPTLADRTSTCAFSTAAASDVALRRNHPPFTWLVERVAERDCEMQHDARIAIAIVNACSATIADKRIVREIPH